MLDRGDFGILIEILGFVLLSWDSFKTLLRGPTARAAEAHAATVGKYGGDEEWDTQRIAALRPVFLRRSISEGIGITLIVLGLLLQLRT